MSDGTINMNLDDYRNLVKAAISCCKCCCRKNEPAEPAKVPHKVKLCVRFEGGFEKMFCWDEELCPGTATFDYLEITTEEED